MTLSEVIADILAWAYVNSLVELDPDRVGVALGADGGELPTAQEIEDFICCEEGTIDHLIARYPHLHAYLEEEMS